MGVRCGRCTRPILAGDAFQCTNCSMCYHGSCWISTPSCTCGSESSRVVHVSPNGRIASHQVVRKQPVAVNPIQSTVSRSMVISDENPQELECSNCLLPVDTLNKPCPFCGHSHISQNQIIIRNTIHYDDAPWGLKALSAINRAAGVVSWFMAGIIPFVAGGTIESVVISGLLAAYGYLNWRVGTDLLKKKQWAKNLLTAFAIISLFTLSPGALWGILQLSWLHSDKAKDYFENRPQLPEKTD